MHSASLSSFLTNNMVIYPDLGDFETFGTSLDEVIEILQVEPIPPVSVSQSSKMLPLIMDLSHVVHPVFKEDCKIKNPFCFGYRYSSKRMPLSSFDSQMLQISIIDQGAKSNICTLCYRGEELEPEGWEVVHDLALLRNDIPRLIQLLRRIQNARLSDLLE